MQQPHRRHLGGVFAAMLSLTLAACAGQPTSEAPSAEDDDTADFLQQVTSGSITMTADTPTALFNSGAGGDATVYGSVTFGGSGTNGMGACLIAQVEVPLYNNNNECGATTSEATGPVTCTQNSDCNPYQGFSGGFAYCTASNLSGQKYCYVRPGPASQYCRGTPAGQGLVTAPTTLRIPATGSLPAYTVSGYMASYHYGGDICTYESATTDRFANWLTYGCIGASCSPNSVSSRTAIHFIDYSVYTNDDYAATTY